MQRLFLNSITADLSFLILLRSLYNVNLSPMDILYCLKGNEPLLLDERQNIWIIKTGTIALFATKVKDNLVSGDRQYLFDVGAGEALFAAALGEEWGLLAVAIAPTEIYQINTADLVTQVTVGEERAIELVNGWVNRLKKTFSQEYKVAFVANGDMG